MAFNKKKELKEILKTFSDDQTAKKFQKDISSVSAFTPEFKQSVLNTPINLSAQLNSNPNQSGYGTQAIYGSKETLPMKVIGGLEDAVDFAGNMAQKIAPRFMEQKGWPTLEKKIFNPGDEMSNAYAQSAPGQITFTKKTVPQSGDKNLSIGIHENLHNWVRNKKNQGVYDIGGVWPVKFNTKWEKIKNNPKTDEYTKKVMNTIDQHYYKNYGNMTPADIKGQTWQQGSLANERFAYLGENPEALDFISKKNPEIKKEFAGVLKDNPTFIHQD